MGLQEEIGTPLLYGLPFGRMSFIDNGTVRAQEVRDEGPLVKGGKVRHRYRSFFLNVACRRITGDHFFSRYPRVRIGLDQRQCVQRLPPSAIARGGTIRT